MKSNGSLLSEMPRREFCHEGGDKVDWQGVFAICESTGGTQWYVGEHETSKDPLDAVKRNFEPLQRMGKV